MASFAPLPPKLHRLLEVTGEPFASTATAFLNAIPDNEEHFTRACEILNCLSTVTGDRATGADSSKNTSGKDIGFVLNATFVLYWMYREYNVRLNPFVSHFVETCDSSMSRPHPNNNILSEREIDWDQLDRARVDMILVILDSRGAELGSLSPERFINTYESLSTGREINIASFRSPIDEEEGSPLSDRKEDLSEDITKGHSSKGKQKATETLTLVERDPINGKISSSHSTKPIEETHPEAVESQLHEIILLAQSEPLNQDHKDFLRANLRTVARFNSIDISQLQAMLEHNFDITQSLVIETLSSGPSKNRDGILNEFLPKLELEIRCLEFVNQIVVRPTYDSQPPISSSPTINLQPIITAEEQTRLIHLFLANSIRHLENPYDSQDNSSVGLYARRRPQSPEIARRVMILCMFVRNLLEKEVVTAQEIYYEAQDINMGFLWVKAARELWLNVTGGGSGIGAAGM